jgi:hypothetical protein
LKKMRSIKVNASVGEEKVPRKSSLSAAALYSIITRRLSFFADFIKLIFTLLAGHRKLWEAAGNFPIVRETNKFISEPKFRNCNFAGGLK